MPSSYIDPIAFQNEQIVSHPKNTIPQSHLMSYHKIKSKLLLYKNSFNLKNILFLNMTTDKAGYYAKQHGHKNVVLLNFANRHNPGGGYLNGARAQEEDLCRCFPQLYPSLMKTEKYPFDLRDVICTDPCLCMRDSNSETYKFLDKSEFKSFYFVTAAAPNIRYGGEYFDPEKTSLTIDNILLAPILKPNFIKKEKPCLILGAWGCGAFGNDPVEIAKLMKNEIMKYGGHYSLIIFAVPSFKDRHNFDTFQNVFQSTNNHTM